jgi:Family of unknown function (DUF6527)
MKYEFVEYVPDELTEGMLYVSIPFATAVHKCCCGCGREVVTPLAPTGWSLTFDGKTVSLAPSIGNWSYPCQSHYWIRRNNVEWVSRWQDSAKTRRPRKSTGWPARARRTSRSALATLASWLRVLIRRR